jgi:parvulin-like peptidyl-prolyl isomerase
MSQRAAALCSPASPDEVQAEFERLLEREGGREAFLSKHNLRPEDEPRVRDELARNLLMTSLLDRELGQDADPTEDELRAYYEAEIDRYLEPERVQASHILKSLTHGEDRRESYEALRELRERALAGEDFEKLAAEHSDNPEKGGDLGTFSRGELVEEFEAVAFSMNAGEISPVVVTGFGYHVIKLRERQPARPKPFAEVREQVLADHREAERERRLDEYVRGLEARASIQEEHIPDEVPAPEDDLR